MPKARMANWPIEKLQDRRDTVAAQLQRIEDVEKIERREFRKQDLQRTLSRLTAEMERRTGNGAGATEH